MLCECGRVACAVAVASASVFLLCAGAVVVCVFLPFLPIFI